MRELSEVKDSLDMEVKQNFIDPLQNLHDKDLREIQVAAACPWGVGSLRGTDVGAPALEKACVLCMWSALGA